MIDRFRGEYFFLSNMAPLPAQIPTEQDILVPTSEHAYQAAKFVEADLHRQVAEARAQWDDPRPWALGLASKERADKLIASGVGLRPNWDNIKIGVMHGVLRQKFAIPELAGRLADTIDHELVEGNNWDDNFWGFDRDTSGTGQNNLGKLLMQVRAEILGIEEIAK